jgi:hypothetical protein
LQERPLPGQLVKVDLRPSLDKSLLLAREAARDEFDSINRDDGYAILVLGMGMRAMVRLPGSVNMRITIPKKRQSSGKVAPPTTWEPVPANE